MSPTSHRDSTMNIPPATMERMPRYLMQLYRFKNAGFQQVSSQMLGESLRIKDTQIRKDLSYFGVFGRARYGYSVDALIDAVEKILGLNMQYRLAIVGFGRMGRALTDYHGSECHNFCVEWIFDVNPHVVGEKVGPHTVHSLEDLEACLQKQPVDIALITTPDEAALDVAQRLVRAGVHAIYNFTAAEIPQSSNVFVENAQIAFGLYKLAHRLAGQWPRKR